MNTLFGVFSSTVARMNDQTEGGESKRLRLVAFVSSVSFVGWPYTRYTRLYRGSTDHSRNVGELA